MTKKIGSTPRLKIYMIGIKGVGMTMLAEYLFQNAYEVSGSDTDEKFMTDQILDKNEIKYFEGFDENNVPKDVDLIVYSSSYNKKTNPELKKALEGKVKVLSYAQMLGRVFNEKYGISVVGSHGKTTTTAWLGYVLEKSGLDPSVMVGARVPQFDGASICGKSNYLIIEADEYQNKLQYFSPQGVLLNNIDYDHPDFFPSKDDYIRVFIDYIKRIPKKGFLIANYDDLEIKRHARVNSRAKIISYAIDESADYIAYDIKEYGSGKNYHQIFKIKLGSDFLDEPDRDDDLSQKDLGEFKIKLLGRHNIYNALAVVVTALELGLDLVQVRKYLSEFEGTARRMEIMGEFKKALILDDYAHHPTEIKTTIKGLKRAYQDKNIIAVFHPHTFTRTKALFNDFIHAFQGIDELIVLDIYGSAREEQGGVHSRDLVKAIQGSDDKQKPKIIKYIPSLKECESYLRENINRDDLVLLIGAGDVFRIGENLVG